MTRRINGQLLSVGNQSLSRAVLENNLRPKPANQWDSDELSQAAVNVLDAATWSVDCVFRKL